MSSDYTPTTGEIEVGWRKGRYLMTGYEDASVNPTAEFNRWLEQHDEAIRDEVRKELAGKIDELIAQLQKEREEFDFNIRQMGF